MNENMNNSNYKNLPIGGSSESKDTGREGGTIGGGMGSLPIGGLPMSRNHKGGARRAAE